MVRGPTDVSEFLCVSVRYQSVRNIVCGGKVHPVTDHAGTEGGVEVYLYPYFNLGAGWGRWSMPRPGRFTTGKDPVPVV